MKKIIFFILLLLVGCVNTEPIVPPVEPPEKALVDYCGISQEVITADDPNYANLETECTSIPKCTWQNLGGEQIKHYSCCPNDILEAYSPAKHPDAVADRCLVMID